ncbi:hypothetical protein GCM10023115_00820 [Pontixanthobacter gangjinensis]|uniref:DUF1134 domain-containing protein n=1 Tax=Pontixanthobacter gangjinensis TaxID=1028742 RepID=A0A6I4SKM6_9SPHN|nr:DUF1134 domain-containing protein [Pontixanthobacter gangjinensis]MXO55337.1 DUF1134 domain-containing protein [Pontixanthobacter gangjinensis]
MRISNPAKIHWAKAKCRAALVAALSAAALISSPLAAQAIETVDPNETIGAIDGDLAGENTEQPGDAPIYADEQVAGTPSTTPPEPSFGDKMLTGTEPPAEAPTWSDPVMSSPGTASEAGAPADAPAAGANTYKEDDLIGAAEGLFGKGAEGVANLIQDLLKDQGEPNAYIVGREAGGAFIIGARYGSGTLYHKIEGERPVYWTGPSIGFDAGANAGNTFVLVYNLYDSEDLFKRFPAGEGQAYLVGGMHVSYMRRGDKVLIPIRVGAGLRLGINAGYMRFSKKQRWLPF